jgi:type II secretion system protein G
MKTTTKSAFHRGFTLIELMIVIVILGILMGTILPRLSGAQGRARDTARVADLGNMSQVLELFYSDFGYYPPNNVAGTPDCIEEAATAGGANVLGTEALSNYIKGGTFPTPPSASDTVTVDGATCTGEYMYLALEGKGQVNQGYVLFTTVETATKANMLTAGATGATYPASYTPMPTTITDDGTGMPTVDSILDYLYQGDPSGLITFDESGGYANSLYMAVSGT